jgi:RHS repeat-associated protein
MITRRCRLHRWLGGGLSAVLLLSLAAAAGDHLGSAGGPDVVYVYDGLGRLAAVTDPGSDTAVYRYDRVGNLVGIDRFPSSQVSVLGVTPRRAAPGAQVVVQGTGFAADPSGNRVRLGDAEARVVRASPVELVVVIPDDASTGPVAVSTSGGGAARGAWFELLRDASPVVAGFSPAVVHPGETLTIVGERFTGDAMLDQVSVRSTYAAVESASATELRARVSPVASTGPVSVSTPDGSGQSGTELFVIPWREFTADQIGSAARARLGDPFVVDLQAGRAALVAFEGRRGQRLAVSAAGDLSCLDITVGLAGPGGVSLVEPDPALWGTWCGGPAEQAARLPADGTYTLLVAPVRGGTGRPTLTLTNVATAGPPAIPAPAQAVPPVAGADRMLDGAEVAPVDLANGELVVEHTDLVVPDLVPVAVTRAFRSQPGTAGIFDFGGFGLHSEWGYELELELTPGMQYADLILPNDLRVGFDRATEGTDPQGAVFTAAGARTPAYGAQVAWNGYGFDLTMPDGTTLEFAGERGRLPLSAIRDRAGNAVTVRREVDEFGRFGNVLSVHSPSGRWVELAYDGEDRVEHARDHAGRTVSYRYRDDGVLTSAVASTGTGVEYRYDNDRRLTAVLFSGSAEPQVRVAYTDDGLVARQVLADGSEFTFDYAFGEYTLEVENPGGGEPQRNTVEVVTAVEVTDPTGQVRRVTFEEGRWTSDSYAGTITTVERDPDTGFITALVYPDGSRTEYAYDDAGHVSAVTEIGGEQEAVTGYASDPTWHEISSIVDPVGGTTSYTYDQAGNLATVTNPDGTASSYRYDQRGRIIETVDPGGIPTRTAYEGSHRVTVSGPDGSVTSEYYDTAGRLAAVTDPHGNTTRIGYDGRDQVTAVTDPLGGETRFAYDAEGNLASLSDPAGNTTRYTHDELGRLTSRTDPLGASDRYAYDALGRLTEHVDRRDVRTGYRYDDYGQPVRVDYGAESTVTYRYDEAGRLVEVDDTAYGTVEFEYDGLGRLVEESSPQGTMRYQYDAAGLPVAVTLPDGDEVAYRYDEAGQLAGVANQHAAAETTARDEAGRVTELQLPNGITAGYRFDQAGRLAGIGYRHGGDDLGELTYTYDRAGRRRAVSGDLAATALPEPFAGAVFDAGNRLVEFGGTTLAYDEAGNLVDDGANTYTWNARGQLIAIDGPVSAEFAYDPFGRRVAKTIDGATTRYVWDGDNLAQQISPDGRVTTLLTGLGLDQHYAATTGEATGTYLADIQGSVLAQAGPDGQIIDRRSYSPHGLPDAPGPERVGYAGRELDETGLYYYRARYYHPGLGRFIAEDPLGYEAGDANLYAYAFGDPVNYSDPTGMQAAGLWVCAAVSGWALVETGKWLADWNDLNENGPEPLTDEWDIAYDRLLRRGMFITDTWFTICPAALGIPGVPGLGPVIGSLGRGLPRLATRFPGLATRFPGLTRGLPGIRPPTTPALRGPGTIPRGPATRPPARGLCSFDADTRVLMADGNTKPISEVQPGDRVFATDPVTGEYGPRQVTSNWSHDDVLIDLELADGQTITTTEDHRFWNQTDQQWRSAEDFDPGDQLLTDTGVTVSVTGLDPHSAGTGVAYNLVVDDIHAYHVSAGGHHLLAHNECDGRIPWSSPTLGRAADALSRGQTSITVANRSQAEELFLRLYQGRGYVNTTGMSPTEARRFFGQKPGTYHWDEVLSPTDPHGFAPHLQVHTFEGPIVRIFWPG